MDSNTLYQRQSALIDSDKIKSLPVTIVGAGAVGSFTAFTLAKMGFETLEVWDKDTVTAHNLPNQMYRQSDIDRPKVEALADIIDQFHGVRIKPVNDFLTFDLAKKLAGLVIICVDTMDARVALWPAFKRNAAIQGLLDSRMGAEVAQIHFVSEVIDSDQIAEYEEDLFPSSEAHQAPCTAKAIIFTVVGLASLIADTTKLWVMNQPFPRRVTFDFRNVMMLTSGQPATGN